MAIGYKPVEKLWFLAAHLLLMDLKRKEYGMRSTMTIGRKFALTGAFLMALTLTLGIATFFGLSSRQGYGRADRRIHFARA